MPWFKVDDTLAFHRKTVAAGNAAMGLWVRAGSMCAQQLTDGFVPDHMVATLGTPAQAARLVRAGLWKQVTGGYQFHEWNENGRQPTSTEVKDRRARDATRQAEFRAKKNGSSHSKRSYSNENFATADGHNGNTRPNGSAQVNNTCHGVTNSPVTPLVTPLVTGAPTRPDPTHISSCAEEAAPDRTNNDQIPQPRPGRAAAEKLNATARTATNNQLIQTWAKTHDQPLPKLTYTAMAREADKLTADDTPPAYIWAALTEWHHRTGKKTPGLLPHLAADLLTQGRDALDPWTTPEHLLRDEDIDLMEILGHDPDPPCAPIDIEFDPMRRTDWYVTANRARKAERLQHAREKITQRQAWRAAKKAKTA